MNNNQSPWLHQLKITRQIDTLGSNVNTQIAIVGAGIAGVMTAYFTLKNTDKQVFLIEGGRVAHGATGHNAGQLVFEFEREFYSLVEEYGLEKAADAERSVRNAWILLEEIYADANLTTPMSSFMGYNGYASIERVIEELKNNALRVEAGLQVFPIYISKEEVERLSGGDNKGGVESDNRLSMSEIIPKEYSHLYSIVPQEDLLNLLETEDTQYVAVMSERKGCVNGALLVEEIVGYLLSTYKGRFMLAEDTYISRVVLEADKAILESGSYKITAEKVVLCTNGFEKFAIDNQAGEPINVKFHHMVKGMVGYMAAYLEEMKEPPTALSFFDKDQIAGGHKQETFRENPYFYMTRRPFEVEKNESHNLICMGGPEQLMSDREHYVPDSEYMIEAIDAIEGFLHKTYKRTPKEALDFKFKWHGLMGFTSTGLRVVGEEPKNKVLMYNLGCNGVGILTSIFGGKHISDILAGVKLKASLFDPRREY